MVSSLPRGGLCSHFFDDVRVNTIPYCQEYDIAPCNGCVLFGPYGIYGGLSSTQKGPV